MLFVALALKRVHIQGADDLDFEVFIARGFCYFLIVYAGSDIR